MLIIGSCALTCCMAILGGITTAFAAPVGAYANFLVASLFIWVAIFANTWSPVPWIIAAEIASGPLREKTLAIASWSGFGVGLAVGFVVPYSESCAERVSPGLTVQSKMRNTETSAGRLASSGLVSRLCQACTSSWSFRR